MKYYKLFFYILIAILLTKCHTDDEPENPNELLTPLVEKVTVSYNTGITGNPNRPYYDVVIMDIDRWEICLNLNRARYHCNSYSGHLWYQMGAFIFEGRATAVYNHQLDNLSVIALDSGWDRGHIMYSLDFIVGTNDMYGSFVYYEDPRRTNGINAWLEKGQLGPHIYGLTKESERDEFKPPLLHPKKARSKNDYEYE